MQYEITSEATSEGLRVGLRMSQLKSDEDTATLRPDENTLEQDQGSALSKPAAIAPKARIGRPDFFRRPPLWLVALSLGVAVPVMAVTVSRKPAVDSIGWQSLLNLARARATVDLAENFREDLRRWAGHEGWSNSWSIDQTGFVRPGQLALYIKSVPLSDYRFEFYGSVERKSLGFVYRALDFDNYYAGRIVIVTPGPVPEVAVERYAVINGTSGPVTRIRLPFSVHMDTLYSVQVEAKGDHFTIRIDDQRVDAFNDSRLPSGGVGFFAGRGESSRIGWLRLTEHVDLVGEMCSLFASRFGD